MDKTFTTRIQNKKDTKANWESQNPVLLDGELIMIEDENGDLFYKVGDGTSNYSALPFVGAPIKYVESYTENMLNLRDLESGTYILYGKFHPYSGSTSTCTFSTGMVVSVIKTTATSYIQVYYAKNNTIQYLEITDESYSRNDAKLINMESTANKVTDIDETADDTHYPSARAVRNAFCNTLVVDATSTDGITYTAEVDGITELYEGLQITIRPDISNTSNAMTLNVNGLGDKPIRRPLSFSTYVANSADSGFLHKDAPCRLMYHANYPNRVNGVSGTGIWLMADKVEVSAQDLYGRVPVASGGVPSSAAADNGKILSVVEEAATWKELVTTIDENSDDASVPSAKAVYTLFNEFCAQVNAILETVVNGEGTA